MKQTLMMDLSENIESIVKEAVTRLVHIGGKGIPYRTGLVLGNGYIVSTAGSADEGETVQVLGPDGSMTDASVKGFDARTGLVLLHSEKFAKVAPCENEPPRLGMLAITVAFPSPEGAEARLDMVRCMGEDYFQTDGSAFPGFSGSVVASPSGKVLGMVLSNAPGNRGQAIPFSRLAGLAEKLKTGGSTKRRVLGLRTQPVKEGLLVAEVVSGSASEAAGVLVGDVLTTINGKNLEGPFSLTEALAQSSGEVELGITRGGKNQTIKVTPAERAETYSMHREQSGCCGR
jgi:serine protease Do